MPLGSLVKTIYKVFGNYNRQQPQQQQQQQQVVAFVHPKMKTLKRFVYEYTMDLPRVVFSIAKADAGYVYETTRRNSAEWNVTYFD